MSYNSNLSKRIRTQNTQIISKTQLALQAIKKYEARNNQIFQKNKNILNNPYTIFRQIDDQYTRLHFHKELQLDKIMRLQILPFNQEYFSIDTDLLIFPVRIFLKNVRNQGILYVGYDREYPGVERLEHQGRTGRSANNQKQTNDKKLYDLKFIFNKDMICVLKNQKKKSIHKIYLTVVSRKQLLMLNIKFDYIGYQSYDEQITNRPKRTLTQGNVFNNPFILPTTLKRYNDLQGKNYYVLKEDQLYRNQSLNLKRSNTQNQSSPFALKNTISVDKLSQENTQNKKNKNFLLENLVKIKSHRRQNSKQALQLKKQKQLQMKEKIRINKQQIEQYKSKEKQIKQAASRLKKSIQMYQKLYKQQKLRDRKGINLVTPLVYLSIFMQKSNKAYNKQTQSITKAFTVRHFIKKFTKALRKKYIESILQIGNFKLRNQMSCLHIFQLTSKMILPVTTNKAANVIFSAFTSLQPALILNHALNQSSRYRQCCRTIQRRWVLKYRARLRMLQNFANRHIQTMFIEYPHLRLGLNTYKQGNHCYKLCYEYMKDESIKFRHIYQAYRKRIQQINQFMQANNKIKQYNKGKPENKKKKQIQIPKKPICPQHRFFRNLDILKSMLRSWLEIQYKKILKKTISGK